MVKIASCRSWTVFDNAVVKQTGKSVFINNGTTVYKKAFPFFGLENIKDIKSHTLSFRYRGNIHEIRMDMDGMGRIRMFWPEQFFNDAYDFDENTPKEDLPYLIFTKTDNPEIFDVALIMTKPSDEMLADADNLDDIYEGESNIDFPLEGQKRQRYSSYYERNIVNRSKAIKIHGLKCQICGFDFEEHYGPRGKDFIEVHHVKPLYQKDHPEAIDPKTDLVCVCSNCHSMIHRERDNVLSIDDMKKIYVP